MQYGLCPLFAGEHLVDSFAVLLFDGFGRCFAFTLTLAGCNLLFTYELQRRLAESGAACAR